MRRWLWWWWRLFFSLVFYLLAVLALSLWADEGCLAFLYWPWTELKPALKISGSILGTMLFFSLFWGWFLGLQWTWHARLAARWVQRWTIRFKNLSPLYWTLLVLLSWGVAHQVKGLNLCSGPYLWILASLIGSLQIAAVLFDLGVQSTWVALKKGEWGAYHRGLLEDQMARRCMRIPGTLALLNALPSIFQLLWLWNLWIEWILNLPGLQHLALHHVDGDTRKLAMALMINGGMWVLLYALSITFKLMKDPTV